MCHGPRENQHARQHGNGQWSRRKYLYPFQKKARVGRKVERGEAGSEHRLREQVALLAPPKTVGDGRHGDPVADTHLVPRKQGLLIQRRHGAHRECSHRYKGRDSAQPDPAHARLQRLPGLTAQRLAHPVAHPIHQNGLGVFAYREIKLLIPFVHLIRRFGQQDFYQTF